MMAILPLIARKSTTFFAYMQIKSASFTKNLHFFLGERRKVIGESKKSRAFAVTPKSWTDY